MDPDLFPTCKFEQTKVAWMNSKAPLQPHPLQDGGTRFTQSLPQSLTIKLISEAFLIAILLDHPWALEGPPAPAPTLATSSRDTSPPGRRTLWYTHSNTTIGAWGRSSWITVRMCRMQSHRIKCQHECRKCEINTVTGKHCTFLAHARYGVGWRKNTCAASLHTLEVACWRTARELDTEKQHWKFPKLPFPKLPFWNYQVCRLLESEVSYQQSLTL